MTHISKRFTRMIAILLLTTAMLIGWFRPKSTPTTHAASTLTVTTTDDTIAADGACSLREAIEAANSNASINECAHDGSGGTDTIEFNIGGGVTHTLAISPQLPTLVEPVIIDGWTQGGAGYAGPPLIMLDGSGTPNGSNGLVLETDDSTIRGLVISRFAASAINIAGGRNNVVEGNRLGSSFAGDVDGGSQRYGVLIEVNSVVGSAENNRLLNNLISGNDNAEVEIRGSTTISASGTVIMGNRIGSSADGMSILDAGGLGINATSAHGLQIGTDGDGVMDSAEGNQIVGTNIAINLLTSDGATIAGNLIGTNADTTAALNNNGGIHVTSGENTRIGSNSDGVSDALERNVISGNVSIAVRLLGSGQDRTVGTMIAGNHFGTNLAGDAAIANGNVGIHVRGYTTNTRIGSDLDGSNDVSERNVISASGNPGVWVQGVNNHNVLIANNYIGTNAAGTVAFPNASNGISINGINASGSVTVRNNLISGNLQNGIEIIPHRSSAPVILGNLIGTDATGTQPLGNQRRGIYLRISPNAQIGGVGTDEGNVIAFNGADGVRAETGTGYAIRGNSIFDNGGLGINLVSPSGASQVTLNDVGDADVGVNNLQNFPVISGTINSRDVQITGTLNSISNTTFTVDFYGNTGCNSNNHGEGRTWLGETQVTTDANGNANIDVTLSASAPVFLVTATATDPLSNTSEFSRCDMQMLAVSLVPRGGNSAEFPRWLPLSLLVVTLVAYWNRALTTQHKSQHR